MHPVSFSGSAPFFISGLFVYMYKLFVYIDLLVLLMNVFSWSRSYLDSFSYVLFWLISLIVTTWKGLIGWEHEMAEKWKNKITTEDHTNSNK